MQVFKCAMFFTLQAESYLWKDAVNHLNLNYQNTVYCKPMFVWEHSIGPKTLLVPDPKWDIAIDYIDICSLRVHPGTRRLFRLGWQTILHGVCVTSAQILPKTYACMYTVPCKKQSCAMNDRCGLHGCSCVLVSSSVLVPLLNQDLRLFFLSTVSWV